MKVNFSDMMPKDFNGQDTVGTSSPHMGKPIMVVALQVFTGRSGVATAQPMAEPITAGTGGCSYNVVRHSIYAAYLKL